MTKALSVWAGSKLCATERSLTGSEVLELQEVDDSKSPLHGLIPIPPVLDLQCDSITIEHMKSVTAALMKAIMTIMKKAVHLQWLEIFLAIFIVINTMEYNYGISKEFQDYMGKTVSNPVPCIRSGD